MSQKSSTSNLSTYQKGYFKRFRTTLSGLFALRTHFRRLYPLKHTESIKIIGQVSQPNLGLRPNQPNRSKDQIPRPHGLHPKDVFHSTPNPRTRPVPPSLPIRQFLMPAALALKMLPKLPLLQLPKLFLRTIRRVRPHIPTAVVLIQKFLKDLTVMNRRRSNLIIPNQLVLHIHIYMVLIPVIVLSILLRPASIGILLTLLLLAPTLRHLPCLNLPVLPVLCV